MSRFSKMCLGGVFLSVFLPFSTQAVLCDEGEEAMTEEAILARVQPYGAVSVKNGDIQKGVTNTKTSLGGDLAKKHYDKYCAVCHNSGVAGAPKFRDKASWGDLSHKNLDAIVTSAIQGKGSMPPKGACMSCSKEDIRKIVEYMRPR